jgi:ABC-2 type transport system permease protein
VTSWARQTGFHLRHLLRTPFFVQQAMAAPLSFFCLRALAAGGAGTVPPPDLWATSALAGIWATTTTAVGMIGFQRHQGTLEHLVLSTRQPAVVFSSLCSAATLVGLVGVPLSLVAQALTSGRVTGQPATVLGLAAGTVACAASSLLLSALFVSTRSATVYEPLVLTPVWLLTGLVVPLAALPEWATPVALAHPLTGAVLAAGSDELGTALGWVAVSVLVSAVWSALGLGLLVAALRRGRRDASLALS